MYREYQEKHLVVSRFPLPRGIIQGRTALGNSNTATDHQKKIVRWL